VPRLEVGLRLLHYLFEVSKPEEHKGHENGQRSRERLGERTGNTNDIRRRSPPPRPRHRDMTFHIRTCRLPRSR
jgi:hypothetical protein